jgi:hypothetical protein
MTNKLPFFILALITLGACTVYRDIPIEVLKPKEFKLTGDDKVSLVYRNFKYDNDTVNDYYRHNLEIKKDLTGGNTDSLIATTALNELSKVLISQNVITQTTILQYNSLPRVTGEKLFPLPAEVIQNISGSTGSSKILVLETLSALYSRYTAASEAGESADVIMAGIWAIYNGHTGLLEKHLPMIDTLYWNRRNEAGERIVIPPRNTALELATAVFVENFAHKFSDNWKTVQRVIIVPPVQEFNLAAGYAEENEWENALALWEKFSSDRYGRLSVSARFNMALAFEMLNDLDQAVDWITQAVIQAQIYKNKEELNLVKRYQRILTERKTEIGMLLSNPE